MVNQHKGKKKIFFFIISLTLFHCAVEPRNNPYDPDSGEYFTAVPEAVANLSISNVSAGTVALSWDDSGPLETAYRLRYVQSNSSETNEKIVSEDATEALIDQLEGETQYTFEISAINRNGHSPAKRVHHSPLGYTLVWQDEFNASSIDTDNWNFDYGTGAQYGLNGWGNGEMQYYASEEGKNISNGMDGTNQVAIFTAIKDRSGAFPYSSAKITTKDKHYWKYGKIVARIKLPDATGVFPAFWMMPQFSVYGGWPASGEIDIMELVNSSITEVYNEGWDGSRIGGTVHYGENGHQQNGDHYDLDGGELFSEDYHIFAVTWTEAGLSWTMDGIPYHYHGGGKPFDEEFFVMLNLAVGAQGSGTGLWVGVPPENGEGYPEMMYVDWVRVYQ